MQKKTIFTVLTIGLMAMGCTEKPNTESAAAELPAVETTAGELAGELSGNCTAPEFRQLDFWVGNWDLSWAQPDGNDGAGTNIISNSPYGNCVVTENFDGAPSMQFKGMSVSTYQPANKLWRQAWVDDQGGYFSLYGGPQEDGTFKLDMERVNDQGPIRRMVWRNIEADSLDWHWQGKTDAAAEWGDLWVIHYSRQ